MQRKAITRSQSVDDQSTHAPYTADQLATFHRQLRSGIGEVFVHLHDPKPDSLKTSLPDKDADPLGDTPPHDDVPEGDVVAANNPPQNPDYQDSDGDDTEGDGDDLDNVTTTMFLTVIYC